MREGIEELAGAYAKYGLTYDDFCSSRFVRLRRIRELLSAGLIDDMLRRQTSEPFPAPGTEITQDAHLWSSPWPARVPDVAVLRRRPPRPGAGLAGAIGPIRLSRCAWPGRCGIQQLSNRE